jgi:hypothetical protein
MILFNMNRGLHKAVSKWSNRKGKAIGIPLEISKMIKFESKSAKRK